MYHFCQCYIVRRMWCCLLFLHTLILLVWTDSVVFILLIKDAEAMKFFNQNEMEKVGIRRDVGSDR